MIASYFICPPYNQWGCLLSGHFTNNKAVKNRILRCLSCLVSPVCPFHRQENWEPKKRLDLPKVRKWEPDLAKSESSSPVCQCAAWFPLKISYKIPKQTVQDAHWRTKTASQPANGNPSACGQNFRHKARPSCIRLSKEPPWESKLVFERTRGWKDLSGLPRVLSISPAPICNVWAHETHSWSQQEGWVERWRGRLLSE